MKSRIAECSKEYSVKEQEKARLKQMLDAVDADLLKIEAERTSAMEQLANMRNVIVSKDILSKALSLIMQEYEKKVAAIEPEETFHTRRVSRKEEVEKEEERSKLFDSVMTNIANAPTPELERVLNVKSDRPRTASDSVVLTKIARETPCEFGMYRTYDRYADSKTSRRGRLSSTNLIGNRFTLSDLLFNALDYKEFGAKMKFLDTKHFISGDGYTLNTVGVFMVEDSLANEVYTYKQGRTYVMNDLLNTENFRLYSLSNIRLLCTLLRIYINHFGDSAFLRKFVIHTMIDQGSKDKVAGRDTWFTKSVRESITALTLTRKSQFSLIFKDKDCTATNRGLCILVDTSSHCVLSREYVLQTALTILFYTLQDLHSDESDKQIIERIKDFAEKIIFHGAFDTVAQQEGIYIDGLNVVPCEQNTVAYAKKLYNELDSKYIKEDIVSEATKRFINASRPKSEYNFGGSKRFVSADVSYANRKNIYGIRYKGADFAYYKLNRNGSLKKLTQIELIAGMLSCLDNNDSNAINNLVETLKIYDKRTQFVTTCFNVACKDRAINFYDADEYEKNKSSLPPKITSFSNNMVYANTNFTINTETTLQRFIDCLCKLANVNAEDFEFYTEYEHI